MTNKFNPYQYNLDFADEWLGKMEEISFSSPEAKQRAINLFETYKAMNIKRAKEDGVTIQLNLCFD